MLKTILITVIITSGASQRRWAGTYPSPNVNLTQRHRNENVNVEDIIFPANERTDYENNDKAPSPIPPGYLVTEPSSPPFYRRPSSPPHLYTAATQKITSRYSPPNEEETGKEIKESNTEEFGKTDSRREYRPRVIQSPRIPENPPGRGRGDDNRSATSGRSNPGVKFKHVITTEAPIDSRYDESYNGGVKHNQGKNPTHNTEQHGRTPLRGSTADDKTTYKGDVGTPYHNPGRPISSNGRDLKGRSDDSRNVKRQTEAENKYEISTSTERNDGRVNVNTQRSTPQEYPVRSVITDERVFGNVNGRRGVHGSNKNNQQKLNKGSEYIPSHHTTQKESTDSSFYDRRRETPSSEERASEKLGNDNRNYERRQGITTEVIPEEKYGTRDKEDTLPSKPVITITNLQKGISTSTQIDARVQAKPKVEVQEYIPPIPVTIPRQRTITATTPRIETKVEGRRINGRTDTRIENTKPNLGSFSGYHPNISYDTVVFPKDEEYLEEEEDSRGHNSENKPTQKISDYIINTTRNPPATDRTPRSFNFTRRPIINTNRRRRGRHRSKRQQKDDEFDVVFLTGYKIPIQERRGDRRNLKDEIIDEEVELFSTKEIRIDTDKKEMFNLTAVEPSDASSNQNRTINSTIKNNSSTRNNTTLNRHKHNDTKGIREKLAQMKI